MNKVWFLLSLSNAAIGVLNSIIIISIFNVYIFGQIALELALVTTIVAYLRHGSSYVLSRVINEQNYDNIVYAILTFTLMSSVLVILSLTNWNTFREGEQLIAITLVVITEGLMRLVAEITRGANSAIKYFYFIFGDLGFKLSVLLSAITVYTIEYMIQNVDAFMRALLFYNVIRASLALPMILKLNVEPVRLRSITDGLRYSIKNIKPYSLFIYWKSTGAPILSDAGSNTVMTFAMAKIAMIANFEILGVFRIAQQAVGLLGMPMSIIEGYISPAIKKKTDNGEDLSALYPVRGIGMTISAVCFLVACLGATAIPGPWITYIDVISLSKFVIVLILGVFLRSLLGSPFYVLLCLSHSTRRTYIAIGLGYAIISVGLYFCSEMWSLIALVALNAFIIDLILVISFYLVSANIDRKYFGFSSMIYSLKDMSKCIFANNIKQLITKINDIRN